MRYFLAVKLSGSNKISSRILSILLGEVLLFVSLIIIEFFNQKIKIELVS